MENRFEHLPPEENQGWGAYATPPPIPGQQNIQRADTPPQSSLCVRVREMLPSLIENDGEIRPEMAQALYGHLAGCPGCAREFDEQQRVVKLVESLGQAELPMDFSARIMRHIQSRPAPIADAPRPKDAAAPPFVAVSVATLKDTAATAGSEQKTEAKPQGVRMTTSVTRLKSLPTQEQDLIAPTVAHSWERLTLAGALSAVLTVFLMTEWGRQMLGVNAESVLVWLDQIGDALRRVPLLGALFAVMVSALSQVGHLLQDTYNTLGGLAARGLALDLALCAGVYYLFVLRRQRGQMRRI
ncbi:MAG TPA: hypothetical protein VFB21_25710 [Chthonomonadaceae bacterium]|nr:hypothetical protein [Chthonomonadaceae bacterium]